ncbi:MAG: hypothetical protein IBX55_12945 [Methyloprofundus sp.]|nr:hypothetical protein [Methyloprofundus sp.]
MLDIYQKLAAHTPLTIFQAPVVLILVDKSDTEKLNKIFNESVPFKPVETYYDRLIKSLQLGEI